MRRSGTPGKGGKMLVWVAMSALLGVLPLVGIGELFAHGLSFTVGGLFMTLILLATSGIFLQNTVASARKMRASKQSTAAEPLKAAQAAAGAEKGT
ncbi:MAG TPA: hypothetical protein VFU27_15730 [Terriglobales bacterium]|nr:hypothetical protein [Terriglobales bacterium]